ncbi:MAG TPA: DUF1801 domain-containing protein [Cyclobacteriaceae bacterium]|nr:DUF1801 domain-containing protein [Cyclobacteriaceae bacterium]
MKAPVAASIDEYIAAFPKETQVQLKQMRAIIHKAAPRAEEKISYGMPAFSLNGKNLIYFAGYKQHIGLYGVPDTKEFQQEFAAYKTSGKGTIQFPLGKPLPVALITRIVKYRIQKIS